MRRRHRRCPSAGGDKATRNHALTETTINKPSCGRGRGRGEGTATKSDDGFHTIDPPSSRSVPLSHHRKILTSAPHLTNNAHDTSIFPSPISWVLSRYPELCHSVDLPLPPVIHRVAPSSVAGDDTGFDLLQPSHQLVDNLSTMSQIRRKDQPILATSQHTIENAEFFLIIRLGSDHLITGLNLFLSVAPIFAVS